MCALAWTLQYIAKSAMADPMQIPIYACVNRRHPVRVRESLYDIEQHSLYELRSRHDGQGEDGHDGNQVSYGREAVGNGSGLVDGYCNGRRERSPSKASVTSFEVVRVLLT